MPNIPEIASNFIFQSHNHYYILQLAMRPVTIWFIPGHFTTAPRYFFRLLDFLNNWSKRSSLMRAIAKWLVVALPAGTPGILARFHILNIRHILCSLRLFHNYWLNNYFCFNNSTLQVIVISSPINNPPESNTELYFKPKSVLSITPVILNPAFTFP